MTDPVELEEARAIAADGEGATSEEYFAGTVAERRAMLAAAGAKLGLVKPAPAPKQQSKKPVASTVTSVLTNWVLEGPLVHEPTGIESLDLATGGGPVYGTRWFLVGAPDAGKTSLLVQIGDVWAERGLVVGVLAVDEEPSDIVMRLMQRRGWTRTECEDRPKPIVAAMHERALEELGGVMLYDVSWTIERAAADVAEIVKARGARGGALLVDSVQTVTSKAEIDANGRTFATREKVAANAAAVRAVAAKHRLIGIATSEMARGFYQSDPDKDDMAAAKETGAIEYCARVMLVLRSVPREKDLVELTMVKNKHGGRGEKIGLQLNRRLQTLTEHELPSREEEDPEITAQRKRQKGRDAVNEAAAVLARLLVERPGMPTREAAPAIRAELGGCSNDLGIAATNALGNAVERRSGPRGAKLLYLYGNRIPDPVLAFLAPVDRARVTAYRPAQPNLPLAPPNSPPEEDDDHAAE